jgi:SAM-dependent methyltransferase
MPTMPNTLTLPQAPDELPEHVRLNRAVWDRWAAEYAAYGERAWAAAEPTWGLWDVPEADLCLLPEDLVGKDVIELGCGTAYVSAWMARRGARVVAIDNSAAQLATASRLQQQHGLQFPLLHGSAEAVPCADASFDFAISEYGACLWADPQRWIAEAARLLRPGGQLVFLTNAFLMALCTPDEADVVATDQLRRPARGLYRVQYPGEYGVEFHLAAGDWIRLLRRSGFEIEDMIDVYAPASGRHAQHSFVTREWASKWPSEEVWKVRRRS